MKTLILMIFLLISTSPLFAAKDVAVVTLIRGKVELLTLGKTTTLKKKEWVKEGDVVKTAEKSFVKLVFIDNSQMNIGPNSEMKIERFSGKDSGVIDLVKGKIRSQVTKDYLQMNDKDKSKIFIKTSNAVMGIRGTDFMISTNGVNTATVLFEGEIVFNHLEKGADVSSQGLEAVVNKGVRMFPGEFSVVDAARNAPTIPALLNIEQKENLERNENFESDRSPSNADKENPRKSIVPGGLDGKVVSNAPNELKKEIGRLDQGVVRNSRASSDPNGFEKGGMIKPTNGSFVHIDTGLIIPPGPGSVLDTNSNTFIPSPGSGIISGSGNFIPPKDVNITSDGKVMVQFTDQNGVKRTQEIEQPRPIMNTDGAPLGQVPYIVSINPGMMNPTQPIKNDIINSQFAPLGLNDLSNFDRNKNGGLNPQNHLEYRPGGSLKININQN